MAGKKVTLYIVCMMTTIVFIGMNFPEVEASGGSFGGGTGTKNNPYVIEDMFDLQAMKNDIGAHYILKNDIDASQTKNWNSGAGFDPVGTYIWNDASKRFTGVLEGNNFTITGLYIYRPIQDNVGLFGCIGSGGSVKNLRIIENNISGRNGVGGLIGSNYGTLSNCFSEGNITGGNEQIGGLIGSNSGKISNCYSFCNVSGKNHVGGLFGYNSAIIDNCSSSGTVKGLINIGGLIGNNYGELYNCYSVNNVNGTNSVGGLIGHNNYCNIF